MYFQLFYSLPVFIEQWVDTTTLYNAIHDISPNLAQLVAMYMPGYLSGLHKHEWVKHGSCYGKNKESYFLDSINLLSQINNSKIKDFFVKNRGKRVQTAKIRKLFEKEFGKSYYERIDAPASKEQKEILKKIDPKDINEKTIGGEEIECIYTKASGNGAKIGGLKIVSKNGWVALRPSGTEDIYKIYAESFISKEHLKSLQQEAQDIVKKIFKDKL